MQTFVIPPLTPGRLDESGKRSTVASRSKKERGELGPRQNNFMRVTPRQADGEP